MLIQVSSVFFLVAFFLYIFSTIAFAISVTGKRWSNRNAEDHMLRWSRLAYGIAIVGVSSQLVAFITRWISGGHIPTSNLFEFISFLAMAIMIAFVIIYFIYRTPALGVFSMPLGVILLAYASVFPTKVEPLIPALKSYWLQIHVTTAALGESFFAVGFAAGLVYLLTTIDTTVRSRKTAWLEFTMFFILVLVGFIVVTFTFKGLGYEAIYKQIDPNIKKEVQTTYTLPVIFKPYQGEAVKSAPFLGTSFGGFEAPSMFKGANAARKLNTMTWSVLSALILYGLLRLLLRKRLSTVLAKATEGLDPEAIDEISYRAIAIGFPVFSLGALIFASIWAQEAWGRFWGWDPKEVWALITWLFYAAYLHLRLSRGWIGEKAAWMAVLGFIVVMFTLVGVNLVIAGLHSYAGV